MNNPDWVTEFNILGEKKEPFFFIIDFDLKNVHVWDSKDLEKANVFFQFRNQNFINNIETKQDLEDLKFDKLDLKTFKKNYDVVENHLKRGDSYLVNLSFCTELKNQLNFEQIFSQIKAKYKVLFRNQWICFSPETFVEINNNKIFTYPMKGTINANIPDAKNKLLQNEKELAEHNTIVDLLRNDLNRVSKNVRVTKFRYIESIKTQKGKILQASSEIEGDLPDDWYKRIGNILFELLPAGSISGAPKNKTVEVIKTAENYNRGFYTGICGYFDGQSLDTGIMIRFIEKIGDKFYYKSGGGITAQSRLEDEYNEIYEKIYLPI